jgi:hypothetical protein
VAVLFRPEKMNSTTDLIQRSASPDTTITITDLRLIPTRDITRRDDYSQSIQKHVGEIIELANWKALALTTN